jgi:hypothetical protein
MSRSPVSFHIIGDLTLDVSELDILIHNRETKADVVVYRCWPGNEDITYKDVQSSLSSRPEPPKAVLLLIPCGFSLPRQVFRLYPTTTFLICKADCNWLLNSVPVYYATAPQRVISNS